MHPQRAILVAAVAIAVGFVWLRGGFVGLGSSFLPGSRTDAVVFAGAGDELPSVAPARADGFEAATFASGCFWSTESDFDRVRGVVATTSGYIGGTTVNPTYRQVTAGTTGHTEAVHVVFDPAVVSYEQLLDHYWQNVDPFTADRQFCDAGDQYRPAIFVHDQAQHGAADASKVRQQARFTQPIVVPVVPAGPFYQAEDWHQDYHARHSPQYRFYRFGCGRDARLEEIAALAR